MVVYLLKTPDNYPLHLVASYVKKLNPDKYNFFQGEPVSFKGEIVFEVKTARKVRILKFDQLCNNSTAPLVSKRLADLLISVARDDIQLLPAKIIAKDGEIDDEFFLVNVIRKVKGVDREKSIYTGLPDSLIDCAEAAKAIMSFDKLVLSFEKLQVVNIARLEEYHSYILISEPVKEIIDGLSGVKLITPAEITP